MLPAILTLIFIYLKLTSVIEWSWLAVCSPVILMIAINVLILLAGIIKVIYYCYLAKKEREEEKKRQH